jgi:GT2 family glycosyltransferase
MFAFGCLVADEDVYRAYALPRMLEVAEPDTLIIERRGATCMFRAYNDILAEAAQREDLEGVVLLHQDVEIIDPDFLFKLRRRFADPEAAIVGPIGGTGLRGMAWWECEAFYGGIHWDRGDDDLEKERFADPLDHDFERAGVPVDSVDGLMLVLSPWAARELRFDEDLGPGFHGYDTDICFQANEAGKKVYADRLEVIHHDSGEIVDVEGFVNAHVAFGRKWRTL